MEDKRKWLVYVSYTKKGIEQLADYQLIVPSRTKAKYRAMDRMIIAGGENRRICEIHEINEEFRRKEADMLEH